LFGRVKKIEAVIRPEKLEVVKDALGECCITPVFFKLQPLIKFQKPMDRYIMVNIWLSLSI
jgi:hypothetical protein